MLPLYHHIAANTEWLTDRVLHYARQHGYALYAPSLADAWRTRSGNLCSLILAAIHSGDCGTPLSADHDPMADPLATFGMNEAKLHRERGVEYSKFFGMLKYCRRAYGDLIAAEAFLPAEKDEYRQIIDCCFDRVELGALSRWTAVPQDLIQELRDDNLRLTIERNKFFTIFETLPNPVLYIGQDSRSVEMFNRAAADLFYVGSTHGASCGGRDSRPVPAAVADVVTAFAASGKPAVTFNAEVAAAEGESHRFIVLMHRMLDLAGQFRGYVAIFNDVTSLKEMEARIEVLHTDLAARAYELEQVNRELEAFNYTVSHDLRAPLTGINGYCQLILHDLDDRLDAQCRTYVQSIYQTGQRMDQLITTLLDFSRLGKRPIQWLRVDLARVAAVIMARLRMNDPQRRVTATIADAAMVEGDPNLLQVVMENLLGNAWKYTSGTADAVIEFGVTDSPHGRWYFVRDNGAGFDMAEVSKLFKPFQRLHDTIDYEGFGVGLATVAQIVSRHGGQVRAEGTVGRGATFCFTLGGKP